MRYIMIGNTTYDVNTDEEIAYAQWALANAGLAWAWVWVGEPDDISWRTHLQVWAN